MYFSSTKVSIQASLLNKYKEYKEDEDNTKFIKDFKPKYKSATTKRIKNLKMSTKSRLKKRGIPLKNISTKCVEIRVELNPKELSKLLK